MGSGTGSGRGYTSPSGLKGTENPWEGRWKKIGWGNDRREKKNHTKKRGSQEIGVKKKSQRGFL